MIGFFSQRVYTVQVLYKYSLDLVFFSIFTHFFSASDYNIIFCHTGFDNNGIIFFKFR